MSRRKIKKSEIKQWMRENFRFIIFSVIFAFAVILIFPVSSLFGVVAVYAREPMLTSLIEAEATILGFFGLIVVYALSSLDKDIDRRDQQLHTRIWEPLEKYEDLGGVKKTYLTERLSNVREKKRTTVRSALITGAFLIGSLMFSILALGIPNDEWAFRLSSFSVALLFASILEILWTIYDLR